jgi:hypothetical protein
MILAPIKIPRDVNPDYSPAEVCAMPTHVLCSDCARRGRAAVHGGGDDLAAQGKMARRFPLRIDARDQ